MILRPASQPQPPDVRVSGGPGTLVTQVGRNVALRAFGKGRRFSGSWKTLVAGNEVSVGIGFVNGMEPFIGKKLLGGIGPDKVAYKDGPPLLQLKDNLYAEDGRSWIGVRVRVSADLRMKEKDYTEDDFAVVQSPRPLVLVGLEGFFAFAVLRRAETDAGAGTLRQIGYFDFQHGISLDGEKRPRHWFFPA